MSEAISFFVIEDHSLTNLGIRQILSEKAALVCKGFAAEKSEAFEKLTELDMKGQQLSALSCAKARKPLCQRPALRRNC